MSSHVRFSVSNSGCQGGSWYKTLMASVPSVKGEVTLSLTYLFPDFFNFYFFRSFSSLVCICSTRCSCPGAGLVPVQGHPCPAPCSPSALSPALPSLLHLSEFAVPPTQSQYLKILTVPFYYVLP